MEQDDFDKLLGNVGFKPTANPPADNVGGLEDAGVPRLVQDSKTDTKNWVGKGSWDRLPEMVRVAPVPERPDFQYRPPVVSPKDQGKRCGYLRVEGLTPNKSRVFVCKANASKEYSAEPFCYHNALARQDAVLIEVPVHEELCIRVRGGDDGLNHELTVKVTEEKTPGVIDLVLLLSNNKDRIV